MSRYARFLCHSLSPSSLAPRARLAAKRPRAPRRTRAFWAFLVAIGLGLSGAKRAQAANDVCYRGGPVLANFKLNGTATLTDESIVITKNQGNQGGSAMYQSKFSTAQNFHIQMKVKISPGSAQPADGMAFIMHNNAAGTSALGQLGGGVGYATLTNSVVVEFDTYQNSSDPSGPHIALTRNGAASHSATDNTGLPVVRFSQLSNAFNPTDGTPFNIWIDYLSTSKTLNVFVSQSDTKPASTALTATLDLPTLLGSDFFVGFTGSTGGSWNLHEFLELYVTDNGATAQAACCNSNSDCVGSSFGTICDPVKNVCGTCTIEATTCGGGDGCNLSSSHNSCMTACDGNFGSSTSHACSAAAYPACRTSGVGAGSCAACGGDFGTGATASCASGAPYCAASGYCGLCSTNADCTAAGATHAGAFCNSDTGRCLTSCAGANDCGPANYCAGGTCAAKAANGQAIPGGTCSVGAGQLYCASGVCSTSNNTCGYTNGSGSCTPSNATTVCQSGACSTAGVCIPAASGACYVDGECASNQYCERSSFSCKSKLAAGASIPSDGLHDGTCSPANASAVCSTGACNTATNTCAAAAGTACTAAAMCTGNLCGSNGLCGGTNGTAGCTGANAGTYCQSGACSTGGVCVPAGNGRCYGDGDCASDSFCVRSTFTCTPKLGPGSTIPDDGLHGGVCTSNVATAVCTTGLCNAITNTCASALNALCANNASCANNVCGGNGQCGAPSGTGSCTAGTAATVCQSGACSTGGVCLPAGSGACWVDADCAGTHYCDRALLSCVTKRLAGAPIPNDGLHGGACASALAVCATGLCNESTTTCAGGLGSACSGAAACQTNVCGGNGLCGLGLGEGPCSTATAASSCQSGVCSAAGAVCIPAGNGGCGSDVDCAGAGYCDAGTLTCQPKLEPGAPLPTDKLHDGTCTPSLAVNVCASGACNPVTNTCANPSGNACTAPTACVTNVCTSEGFCGLARGAGPCTSDNASTICASGVCSATAGVCLGTGGGCWVDADCGAERFCDRNANTCRDRLAPGAPLPNDGQHDGACTPEVGAAVCASGACNATTSTCGGTPSSACTTAAECAVNHCGGNGRCGFEAGSGTCTGATAAAVCQSGTCGPESGVCVPSGGAGCGSDDDCADAQFCEPSSKTCKPRLAPGAPLPVAVTCTQGMSSACATGLCNAVAGSCATATGETCAAAADCVSNVCGRNGRCGWADGEPGCEAGNGSGCQSGVCTMSGVCGANGCALDSECPNTAFCNGTGLCQAKLPAGATLPMDPVRGACPSTGLSGACESGRCNATQNTCARPVGGVCASDAGCDTSTCGSNGLCGIPDGAPGCMATTGALCQSGVCSATGGRCVPAQTGACAVDADCGASTYCNGTMLTCVPRLGAGVPLPKDGLHQGVCMPGEAAAVCASGLCNAAANTCAEASGALCTTSTVCEVGFCAQNGRCGWADGQGSCSRLSGGKLCQSGVCSAQDDVCVPNSPDACAQDEACGPLRFCDRLVLLCKPKLSSGAALPVDPIHDGLCTPALSAAVCATGICSARTNTCAVAQDLPVVVSGGGCAYGSPTGSPDADWGTLLLAALTSLALRPRRGRSRRG